MPNNTIANGQTVVHRDSGGVVTTTPDVCLTPVGNATVPVPYVNVANSADTSNGSKTVTVDGNPIMLKGSFFSTSSGDEPGNAGGLSSGVTKGKAKFVNYSFDVFVEGKPVCRRLDPMVSNLGSSGNTPPAALMQPNAAAEGKNAEGYILALALQMEHPDTISRHVSQPLLNAGYNIYGPETFRVEKGEIYQGLQHMVGKDGTYSLKFTDFDRKQKTLEPDRHEDH